jgi:CBS domain-containing protein
MKVRDLMTPNPQTVRPSDLLSVVESKMQQARFRRLPVVDDAGKLIGIVSDGDLRQHLGYLATTRVRAAMVEKPITVAPDAPVETAAQLMIWHKMGGLPVLDDAGQLLGIITESDLLHALVDARNLRREDATRDSPPSRPP